MSLFSYPKSQFSWTKALTALVVLKFLAGNKLICDICLRVTLTSLSPQEHRLALDLKNNKTSAAVQQSHPQIIGNSLIPFDPSNTINHG